MLRKLALGVAALALAGAPVAGSLAAQDRASAPVHGANGLKGRNSIVFLAGIAVIVAAVILLPENKDNPVSP